MPVEDVAPEIVHQVAPRPVHVDLLVRQFEKIQMILR